MRFTNRTMQHLAVVFAMGTAQTAIRASGLLPGLLALAVLLSLAVPCWLLYICCASRSLHTTGKPEKEKHRAGLLGQPRLLPTQVSHTRLGTGRYNYTVPHLLVGTPVGLQGHVGGVLSLDEPESRAQTAGLMQYLNPRLESWFTVHAHHHLDKGNDAVGLQGKLHGFLVSQGLDPREWPHAYLVTMPQFLGYQRNLVCIWYLYSAARELTAMVMEVNNYWGQRKIAFSRLTGESPSPSPSPSPTPMLTPSGPESCPFYHSAPRHASYRGTWAKDMFISPFEKVEGTIALRFSDPLAPNSRLHITITLLSPSGKPRLVGRVFCPEAHDPLDPLTASSCSLLRFLPYWTGVLVVTELLIVAAALRIRSKGARLFSMPEVRPNNLPRDETDIERALEPAFRAYIKHLVDCAPSPLTLDYIPSKSHHLVPESFSSPSASPENPPSPSLTLQVLTPQFYSSFPLYKDPVSAFTSESRPSPLPSDPSSRHLLISDPVLFFSLLKPSQISPPVSTPRSTFKSTLATALLPLLRDTETDSTEYFLDTFTKSHTPRAAQDAYFSALCAHLLASKITFGLHPLLSLYMALGHVTAQAGLSYLLFNACAGLSGHCLLDTAVAMGCHGVVLRVFDMMMI